jgi:peptidoglycan/LPS O-acetylase OafA/YrhL
VTANQPQGRIRSLEALRGLAGLAVTWFHITHGGELLADTSHPLLQAAGWVGSVGYHGITLFFVLSGFVIPLSIQRSAQGSGLRAALRGFPIFLLPRLLRLQPPFVAASVLAIGLNLLSTTLPGYRGQFQVTLLPASTSLLTDSLFLTGLLGGTWILVVAWTLALEVQFYAIAGLVEPACRAARQRHPWPTLLLGLISVSLVARFLLWPALVFGALPSFALGWLSAHRLIAPHRCQWLGIAWLLLLIGAQSGPQQAGVALICIALIALAVRFPDRASAPLLWLGSISYSLFLIHVPIGGRVVNLLRRGELSAELQFLVCLLAVAVSLLVAWGFWALIERPSHGLSRRILQPS